MSDNRRASWRHPRILAVLLTVFLCGSLTGAVAMRYWTQANARPHAAVYWTEGGREITLQHFKAELELTPEQTRQMEIILDDFMQYIHSLQAQMDDVRANGKERIMRMLNPEQQKKFKKMLKAVPSPEVH